MTTDIRVRYAPSPTGHLHIGNARTAVFNYLFARHYGGDLIIRIEDTDTKRNVEGGEASQLDNLQWLGVDWDESPQNPGDVGPYRQSERVDLYRQHIDQLLASGHAYPAFDTPEELEKQREKQRANGIPPHYTGKWRDASEEEIEQARQEGRPEAIRFRIPDTGAVEFDDMVKGKVRFENDSLGGDFIILKNDGMPTYNFGVVVDDHLMGISHVLRGDDHVANTPKQILMYQALDWEVPTFGHMTLIFNADTGKKLSKRDEGVLQFIEDYRQLGYHPDGLFNYMSLLGWSPEGEEEIYSPDQLVEIFDVNRLSKSQASFDQAKMDWMSGQYISRMDSQTLTDWALPHLQKAGLASSDPSDDELAYIQKVVQLYQKEMDYAAQVVDLAAVFFQDAPVYSKEAQEVLQAEEAKTVMQAFKAKLTDLDPADYTANQVQAIIKEVQKETGVKGKGLYMPLRASLIGEAHGPGANEVVGVFGKEKTLDHLTHSLDQFHP